MNWRVILNFDGGRKVEVVKVVTKFMELTLTEARELVDRVPCELTSFSNLHDAEVFAARLNLAVRGPGAIVHSVDGAPADQVVLVFFGEKNQLADALFKTDDEERAVRFATVLDDAVGNCHAVVQTVAGGDTEESVLKDEDAVFIEAIMKNNPQDDGPRLVYADWFEERGDCRGDYLRLEIEIERSGEIPDHNSFDRLAALRSKINPAWLALAEKKYDAVLISFGASKISVCKVIRDAANASLMEVKRLVESAPAIVLRRVSRIHAERFVSTLKNEAPDAIAEVRPSH